MGTLGDCATARAGMRGRWAPYGRARVELPRPYADQTRYNQAMDEPAVLTEGALDDPKRLRGVLARADVEAEIVRPPGARGGG